MILQPLGLPAFTEFYSKPLLSKHEFATYKPLDEIAGIISI